jgi:hypothetical protein
MPKVLLIVECQPNLNWYSVFEGLKLFGTEDVRFQKIFISHCNLMQTIFTLTSSPKEEAREILP